MSVLQVDKIQDAAGTTNKELAEYSSSAWSWGSGVPQHTIIQIQQTVKTTQTSRTNSNASIDWADISGMSCDITPRTGSKVLVQVFINAATQTNYSCAMRLVRGSTAICVATDAQSNQMAGTGFFRVGSDAEIDSHSIVFLDTSPGGNGSTAITYKMQWDGENGGTMHLNKHHGDGNNYAQARLASTIVLMEVAG